MANPGIGALGIIAFFRRFIPKAFKDFVYGIPHFHEEILWEVLRDSSGWKFYDRKIVVAAPRGSSKTTLLSKGLALYCALFGIKKYIVLASKTSRAAQKNLRFIKQMLGKSIIIRFFGDLRPESRGKRLEYDTIEGKWTSDIIVLKNGVTIEALGMGQQFRGSTEGEEASRVDLFIADDTETDENTRTPERREANNEWLFETVLPTLDVDTGTIIFINTMTDTQSILATLLNSDGWRKKFYQITYFDDHGKERPLWPEKFPLSVVEKIRKDYESFGRVGSFYKEYYNLIQSDEGFSERWIKNWSGRVFNQNGQNWIEFVTEYDNEKVIRPCYITLGVDLAFSESSRADFAVLLALAQIPDGRKFILTYSRGRYSVFDDMDGINLVRKGIISEAIRLHSLYNFDAVRCDATAQQRGVFTQLKQALSNSDKIPVVMPDIATRREGDKFHRLKDALQPQYEVGNIHHQRGMNEIKVELISFGNTTDDILDALYYAMKCSRKPEDASYSALWGALDSGGNELVPVMSPERRLLKSNWMCL